MAKFDVDSIIDDPRLQQRAEFPYENVTFLFGVLEAGGAFADFDAFCRAHRFEAPDLAGRRPRDGARGPSQVLLRLAGVLTFLDCAAQPAGTAEPQQVAAWAVEFPQFAQATRSNPLPARVLPRRTVS